MLQKVLFPYISMAKSCGTGSMSCAAVYRAQGHVHVWTAGGPLEITLEHGGIELKGTAFLTTKTDKFYR